MNKDDGFIGNCAAAAHNRIGEKDYCAKKYVLMKALGPSFSAVNSDRIRQNS